MTRHEHAGMTVAINEDEMEIGFKGVKYTKTIFNWFKLAVLNDANYKNDNAVKQEVKL